MVTVEEHQVVGSVGVSLKMPHKKSSKENNFFVMVESPVVSHGDEKRRLADDLFKTLSREYVVVGHRRVRAWHAWLAIGLVAGAVAGILFVAARTSEEESLHTLSNNKISLFFNN